VAKRYQSPIIYRLREIPVKQIKTWKDAQARKLDREGIAELAKSIKNEGLQNPPMVQKESKKLILVTIWPEKACSTKKIGCKKRFQFYWLLRVQDMIWRMQRQLQL